eukprot:8987138-Heterocapsa_arctica.AAC.1
MELRTGAIHEVEYCPCRGEASLGVRVWRMLFIQGLQYFIAGFDGYHRQIPKTQDGNQNASAIEATEILERQHGAGLWC